MERIVRWLPWVSSASLAMVVLGVLFAVLPQDPALSAGMENLDLFTAEEDLTFYEKVDFYRWLVQAQHHDAAPEKLGNHVDASSPPPLPWYALSPAQQHVLKRFQDRWNELPAPRQQRLRDHAQRWITLTAEQQASARQRFTQWQSLTPKQRERVREGYATWQRLSPDEGTALRQQFAWFRALAPAQREVLLERWRAAHAP